MADNVTVSSTATFTVACDEVAVGGTQGTGQVQFVKLVDGTLNGTAPIPGDSTNGLKVNVTLVTTVKPDGTNTMPSLDAAARRGYMQLTDGSNSVGVSTVFADAESNTQTAVLSEAYNMGYNGTTWDRIRTDTTNGLWVNVKNLTAGTNYFGKVRLTDGTNDASISTTGGLFVGGAVAHDGTDSGNPLKVGMKTIAHGTNPTAVAAGDRTDLYANRAGIPFFVGGHPNIVTIETSTTGAATDVAIVTVSAGAKVVVTQAQVVADNANTAFPQVRVGFGTANTPTTTGVVLTHPGVPAGGGISRGDGSGIIGVGADNEDLRYTCGAPTGGSIRILVSYYTIES